MSKKHYTVKYNNKIIKNLSGLDISILQQSGIKLKILKNENRR